MNRPEFCSHVTRAVYFLFSICLFTMAEVKKMSQYVSNAQKSDLVELLQNEPDLLSHPGSHTKGRKNVHSRRGRFVDEKKIPQYLSHFQ
jgi:hypothetical protein